MKLRHFPILPAVLVNGLGIALHGYISFFKADSGPSAFLIGLLVWSSLVYVGCLVFSFYKKRRNPLPVFLGGAAALHVDANVYCAVFVAPDSSTGPRTT